ncbi:PDZ domain-containing protein, partial [Propionibacterium freudenreichii]|uniref:PDZ domain-containing protein n=1 Tax=Propionibacterium freudenreichii TaxID=1744 RepID=UPI00385205EE
QAIVLVAGVTFNIVLTWLLLSLAFMLGARSASEGFPVDKVQDKGIVVMYVAPETPASEAGLKMGDEIISISTSNTYLA